MNKIATAQAAEPLHDGKPIEVDPGKVEFNAEGQCWREWQVHLPVGATKSDLQTPSIWKKVQINRSKCLSVKDRVTVFADDESWFADCIVHKADSTGAWLRFSKVSDFREAGDIWSDGTLETRFTGGSWYVHRVSDGIRTINIGFSTRDQAVAAALASYPKRA
ncbi:hypothetical protein LJR235_002377 [Pararhizobium sp. LjRoot235]|uniref:hypothetical protein n=1 Tax=Pararhizobium sp. LjRoot235 TaxID=3342291 RepID=UPI003ECC8886